MKRFGETRPDCVVIDSELQNPGALEVLVNIRRQAAGCVVIVLSSSTEPSLRDHFSAVGADHYLVTSRDPDKLIKVLGDLAERRTGHD